MSMKDEHGLTVREKKFADFVIGGMAAGRAYELAGYAARGSSADSQASRLMRNLKVLSYMKAERKALSEAARIEKYEVLDFLQDVLRTAVGNVDENSLLAQEVTRDSIDGTTVRTKIKMVPKLDALKQLAVMLGWNAAEKKEIDVSDRLAEIVGLARKGG